MRALLKHRLVKDTLVLFGVQITGYLLPLITLPYLTHVLGPQNFGLTGMGTALVLYFVVITEYGFAVTGTRQIATVQEDPELVARHYSTVMACKLTLLSACLVALCIVIAFVPKVRVNWALYSISFLQVIGWGLSPNWLLQGMQRMRYIAWSDYGAKIVSVALIFLVVRQSSDYLFVAALQSGAFLISAGIGLYFVFIKLGIRLVKPIRADMKEAMISGWPVFLSAASMVAVSSTNTLILGFRTSPTEVGFLSAAQRLIIATRALTNPITTAIYPHMSRLVKADRNAALQYLRKQVLWTATPFAAISLGMLILGPFAAHVLYGPKYAETGVLLRLMSMTPVVHAVSMCFGTYYMLAFGYEKAWSKVITRMMVLNFISIGILMMFMRPVRAIALTTTLMDIFSAGSCMLFYRRTAIQTPVAAEPQESVPVT